MTKPVTESDSDAILKTCTVLVTAAVTSDAGLWASLYTPDAVLMAPNHPPLKGREAIRDHMAQEFFGPFQVAMTDQTEALTVVEDLGVRRGTARVTLTPKTGGPPIEEAFKYLETWQRQADGSWKITQDIFNSNTPIEQ